MNFLAELFLGNIQPVDEYLRGQDDYWEALHERSE